MLTPRQAAFVAEYQKDQNATQAAIRAGYSPNGAEVTGSKLLKHSMVRAAMSSTIAKALDKVANVRRAEGRAVATAAYVIDASLEVAEYGRERVPHRNMFGGIIVNEDGEQEMVMRDWKAAASGLDRLAKAFPEFRDGPLIDNSQTLVLPPGTTIEELRALRDGLK